MAEGRKCNFWVWLDAEMCRRSVEIIPDLLRRMNRMEEELQNGKENEAKWERKARRLDAKVQLLEAEVRAHEVREKKLIIAILITYALIMWAFAKWVRGNGSRGLLLQLEGREF